MKYDCLVIGGGPAGLMAAGRAGELGARVLLLEKNNRPGVKLLITGGGRCNLANYITEPKILSLHFGLPAQAGGKGKFLFSAFNKFGVSAAVGFFTGRGLKVKVEKNHQVFPLSDQATDVLRVLLGYAGKSGALIRLKAEVKNIIASNNKIKKIILADGEELEAQNYIIATGGKSYPSTGSTGSGYEWLKQLGHTVVRPRPSLTPIRVKESFVKDLEGLSLDGVLINLRLGGKKIASVSGDIVFTSRGLSGPAILDLSRLVEPEVIDSLSLEIDFFPEIEAIELDKRLQFMLMKNGKKLFSNSLAGLVPPKLTPILLKLLSIDIVRKSAEVTKQERLSLVGLLKHFILNIKALEDFDKAMITAGGVSIKEIDPRTMRSKIIPNLFIAGEILDLDGPTGGYNLQLAWSTGFVAGESAAAPLGRLVFPSKEIKNVRN